MTTSIRFQNALFPAILDVLSASRKLRLGPGFGNRLPEYNHSAYFSLKPLKGLVQKYRGSAEKFENRLLGPTNQQPKLKFHQVVVLPVKIFSAETAAQKIGALLNSSRKSTLRLSL